MALRCLVKARKLPIRMLTTRMDASLHLAEALLASGYQWQSSLIANFSHQ
jgi:hypothetical protein